MNKTFLTLRIPMKNISLIICCLFLLSCDPKTDAQKETSEDEFSFLFMTDMHHQLERDAAEAFKTVIDTANQLEADFIISGGDQIFDVMRGNFERSDSLFTMLKAATEKFNKPFYPCIGNHELFGIYEESPEDPTHPDYKYGMYERYFGKSYYSFDHKGWHFIVLNSIDERNQRYIGIINEEEMEWLKQDIAGLDPETPIAIALHIPLISVQTQIYPRKPITEVPNDKWVSNRNEVLDLFKELNLKLVLQGHMHWIEDINVQGKTRFITGGSVAGRPSWRRMDERGDGIYYNQEGFMQFHINGEEINWEYIDIGWEPRNPY